MSGTVAVRRAGVRSSTITVGGTPTGQTIQQGLRGSLFGLTADPFIINTASVPNNAGALRVLRTDGALQYTPMKAGGVDGAHPTLGHSGTMAYDWTILDAVLSTAASDGFTEIYMSIDYTPSILGGPGGPSTTVPFVDTTWYPGAVNTGPPNDLAAFQTIVGDLVHHCTVVRGANMPYWGCWNEPDGVFWAGTPAQLFAVYAAAAAGVKAINPALKVGGLDFGGLSTSTRDTWLTPFLTYCKANSVPLDFVSWHAYSGDIWELAQGKSFLTQSVAAASWLTPLEMIIGEWAATRIANLKGFGNALPFGGVASTELLQVNDAAAAMTAIFLMELQALGFSRAVFFRSKMDLTDPVNSGLIGGSGRWAPGNVYALWAKLLAGNVLPVTLDADPGIHALACTSTSDLTGTVRVLIASHHYSRAQSFPATVGLAGIADNRSCTLTVIDQQHSNQFDAGVGNAGLQTIPCPSTSGGQVILPPLAARSVVLLEIT